MLYLRRPLQFGCVSALFLGLFGVFVSAGEENGAAQPSAAAAGRALLHQLDEAFVHVFEKVAPAVVVVSSTKKAGTGDKADPDEWEFFLKDPRGGKDAPHSFRMPESPAQSEGSGFIIRADGFIATNYHVVEEAEKIEVRLYDGRRFAARISGFDEKTDVALLKIEAANLPMVEFTDSDAVRVGQLVGAIGVPYKLDYSFSCGWVSAKGRTNLLNTTARDYIEDYIQTDAFINPGSSGGPLFDVDGKVIGMNTLINGIGRGLAFAIPSNMLKDVSDQLISTGQIVRSWLGIRIETLGDDPALRERIHGIDQGVVVSTIEPNAPAYKSDLRAADVITQLDGVRLRTARDLQREVLKKKVGQPVDLTVWRNGKTIKVSVLTAARPAAPMKAANPVPRKNSSERKAEFYGLQLQNVTKELAETLKLKAAGGALVTSVRPESPAAKADVRAEDVITDVDSEPVGDAAACELLIGANGSRRGVVLFIDRKGEKTYAVMKGDK